MTEYSNEALRVFRSRDGRPYLRGEDTYSVIAKAYRESLSEGELPGDANAERLAAAWNACAGIDTDRLKPGAVKELLHKVEESIDQLRRTPARYSLTIGGVLHRLENAAARFKEEG